MAPTGSSRYNNDGNSGNGSNDAATPLHRFSAAVSSRVDELMMKHGYGRERAVALLMEEISDGGNVSPASNEEVFRIMKTKNLGVDDASKVLTVARVLRRARKNKQKSVDDAIADLTAKISSSRMLCRVSPEMSENGVVVPTRADTVTIFPESISEAPSEVERISRAHDISSGNRSVTSSRKNQAKKLSQKSARSKGKTSVRKRPASDDSVHDSKALPKIAKETETDTMDADIAKKAHLSKEQPPTSVAVTRNSKSTSPSVVRTKRTSPRCIGEEQIQLQPVTKRPRSNNDR
eukprot:scaffold509686_cov47-Attheya_sp.AAC.1